LRTCRACGAVMEPDDAFCAECGAHVVDAGRRRGDEAASGRGEAYERPYDRLEPAQPDPDFVPAAEGEIEPVQTFDAPVQPDDVEYEEEAPRGVSPVTVGVGAVLVAIVLAGIVIALSSGDDGSSGGGLGLGNPSAGGFGSMLPDGTIVCAKAPEPGATNGARTAVASTVEIAAPPSTWSSRPLVKGRFQGTGAGTEYALNAADHDRSVPQSARISVLAVETNAAYFPDQFVLASLPPGNATTVTQDCLEYGPLTALRVHRVELNGGATLSTRYVVVHDKTRRGSAALFVFEDPRASGPDAEFFEGLVASAKLLK
jgi:hypothetical protein